MEAGLNTMEAPVQWVTKVDGSAPPVVGAALESSELNAHLDWLAGASRDLEIQDAIQPGFLDGEWRERAKEIETMLRGYPGRIGIHGPFYSLTLLAHDPAIRAVVQERMLVALEFAGQIGATHMVTHSPFTYLGGPFHDNTWSHGLREQIEICYLTLEPVFERLARMKCMLVIETIYDLNPRPLLALVGAMNSDYVRLSVDVGHAYVNHLAGGPTPDQWVWEGGATLAHLHLQDTDGARDRHWPPGRGNINWYALFQALGDLETEPRLIMELNDKSELSTAAAWLDSNGYAQ